MTAWEEDPAASRGVALALRIKRKESQYSIEGI